MTELLGKPLLEGRQVSITAAEAASLLKNVDLSSCIIAPPTCPLDGQVYIYKPLDPQYPDGWKEDGFSWKLVSSSHQPRRNPQVTKRVYALQLPDSSVCKELRKEVYNREDDDQHRLTLLHYLGKFEYTENVEELQPVAATGTPEEVHLGELNTVYIEDKAAPGASSALLPDVTTFEYTQPEQLLCSVALQPDSDVVVPDLQSTSDIVAFDETSFGSANLETDVVKQEPSMSAGNQEEESSPELMESDRPDPEPGSTSQVPGPSVEMKERSESIKQAADSSTGSEDIEMALKTLQTALQKKSGSKPVMDMVSKLVETVTSMEENADMDYTLVVSDKKRGKRSVIGTSVIPGDGRTRSSQRHSYGEEADSDEDPDDSKRKKIDRRRKTNKPSGEAAKQVSSVTELKEYEVLAASGEVVKFPAPKKEAFFSFSVISEEEKRIHSDFFKDSRRSSKNADKYLKIRNHMIITWQKQKPQYLNKSQARKGLKGYGDVTPISRIHTYLESKGVINFSAVRDTSRPWMRKDKSGGQQTGIKQPMDSDLEESGEIMEDKDSDSDYDPNADREGKVFESRAKQIARKRTSVRTSAEETPTKRSRSDTKGKQSGESKQDSTKKTIRKDTNVDAIQSDNLKTPESKNDTSETAGVQVRSRRTRNVATPNWADILSGRKSFKDDGAVLSNVKSEPSDSEDSRSEKEKVTEKKKTSSKGKSPVKKGKTNGEENEIGEESETENKGLKVGKSMTYQKVKQIIAKSGKEDTDADDADKDNTPHRINKTRKSSQGLNRFACSECNEKFATSHLLEEHMKKVHQKAVDGVETEDEVAAEGDEDDDYADEIEMDYDESEDYKPDGDDDMDAAEGEFGYTGSDVADAEDFAPKAHQKNKVKSETVQKTQLSDEELKQKVIGKQKPGEKPTCKVCGSVFLSLANLRRHSLLHSDKMYECPFCARILKRKDYVIQHIRKVHKEEDIANNPIDFDKYTHVVDSEVSVKEKIGSNIEDEVESQPVSKRGKGTKMKVIAGLGKKVCPECSKLFDTQDELEQHMIEVHKKELKDAAYTCQACKKQFKTLVSFQVHKLSHRKKDHVCSHCGKKFPNNSQLQVHRRHDHQLQYGTLMYFGYLMNNGKLACEICSTEFDDIDSYHMHRTTHIIYENLCAKCGNGFLTYDELNTHIESDCSKVNLHLPCGVCEQKFSMYDSRRKHVLGNHPKTTEFYCHHCGLSFDKMQFLTEHFPVHKEEKIFRCEFCEKRFFEKRNLVDHRDLHRSSKNWQCHICDRFYISSKSLQRHIKLHLRNKFKSCKYCPSKFGTADELEEHIKTEHIEEESGTTCRLCEKSFLDKDRLVKHMQMHSDNRYTCDICEGEFDASHLPLWKHMKKDHPEEASRKSKFTFQCDLCDFATPYRQRLERHMESHNEGKEFECKYCGKFYKTTSSLFTHLVIHRGKVKKGAKPQPICFWTGCNKQYMKHSLYKKHLISHLFRVKTGKDLCQCGQCAYSTPQSGQTFFVQDNSEYSAVGYVDEEGNPLVATRLITVDTARTESRTVSSESTEKGYGSMNVLQEAIARIEDIENKDTDPEKKQKTAENESQHLTVGVTDANSSMEADSMASVEDSMEETEKVSSQSENTVEVLTNKLSEGTMETNGMSSAVEEVLHTPEELVDLQSMGYRYECGVCELIFQHKCQVLMHFEEDHPEHRFPQCQTCDKVIIDEKNMREHLMIHEDVKEHKCKICGKCFRTKQILKQHSYIHTSEKPFTCNFCGHGFTQRGFYMEHVRRHTGVKPFKCSVCSKAFVSKNLLRIHMYSHANTRPYQCELCPKAFNENYQLNCHLRTHNEDRPFQCSECDKAFFVRPKLTRHMNTVHGIDRDDILDYVGTRIASGVGYRLKSKQNEIVNTSKDSRVIYVDSHGSLISEGVSHNLETGKQSGGKKIPNSSFVVVKGGELSKSPGKVVQASGSSFVNLAGGLAISKKASGDMPLFEVITRKDNDGVNVNTVIQVEDNLPKSSTDLDISHADSIELNGQKYALMTHLEGDSEGQIALIEQAFNDHEASGNSEGQGQIQVITQEVKEEILSSVHGEQEGMQIVADGDFGQAVSGAANLNINIGEDGTLDPSDFEKIEALQNMYGDQQIVIVLESKQQ